MARILVWEDMWVGEEWANGADWANALAGAGIASEDDVGAEVIEGSVTINTDPPAGFAELEGTIQRVWVRADAPGRVRIMVTCNTDDGKTLKEIYAFQVAAVS